MNCKNCDNMRMTKRELKARCTKGHFKKGDGSDRLFNLEGILGENATLSKRGPWKKESCPDYFYDEPIEEI